MKSLHPLTQQTMKELSRFKSNLVSIARKYVETMPEAAPFTFVDYSKLNTSHETLSYASLDRRARQIASLLQSQGPPGQRVLLLYPSSLDYICAFFGCLYASMIAVPIYPPQNPRLRSRLMSIAKDSGASIILSTTKVFQDFHADDQLSQYLSHISWHVTDDGLNDFEYAWSETQITGDDIAFLQYTSGSTGTPKGVIVKHSNILHNVHAIALHFQFKPSDHCLSWLPPYHDMGLIGAILAPFASTIPVTLMAPSSFLRRPERWLQQISEGRCTISGAPNFAYDLCIRKVSEAHKSELDLSSWNLAYSGAEPVRFNTLKRFAQYFADCGFSAKSFFPCYGLAESTLFVTGVDRQNPTLIITRETDSNEINSTCSSIETMDPPQNSCALVSCGTAGDAMTIKVVEPSQHIALPDKKIGEIWIKGPSVTGGYWQKESETQESFEASLHGGDGGYLRTGDLGFRLGDQLFICGRLKDVIIHRGVNHYPHDIESTVDDCQELISPSSGIAFSVQEQDLEKLIYVQELGPRDMRHSGDIFCAIRNSIAEKHELQVYEIVFIESGHLPKTTSGKLSRLPCKEKYLSQELPILLRRRNSLFCMTQ